MDPDPTRPKHTFDPQLTRGWPIFDQGTFWPDPKGKNWNILWEIFKTQTQTKDGWPDPSNKKSTRPRSKNLNPDPWLLWCEVYMVVQVFVLLRSENAISLIPFIGYIADPIFTCIKGCLSSIQSSALILFLIGKVITGFLVLTLRCTTFKCTQHLILLILQKLVFKVGLQLQDD